jgi:hypothetical protein
MLLSPITLLIIFILWLGAYLFASYLQRRGILSFDYNRDVLALGAIALATIGFFWRILFTKTWMPNGGGDLVSFLYPNYSFASRYIKKGIIPLWNPYLHGGAPFAADNQSGLFYPINLLFFLLTPELTYLSMELLAVFHFFLAGASMYTFLRYVRFPQISRISALAGSIAFMFSDLFVTHFGNLNIIAVAAWLPLIFLFYHRGVIGRRNGSAAASGLFLGISTLAGHIQITLFIVLTLLLYTVYLTLLHHDLLSRGHLAFHLLICLLVAFGLASPSLIPSYEMAGHTLRAELSYYEASRYSLPPAALVGLFIPGIFGRGPGGFWGPWDRVEVGYVGVLTLFLAALAILFRRDNLTRFLLGLAFLSLVLAFGGYAIPHGWLYRFFPGFEKVRAPARFVYLMDFSIAALAAFGLDSILHPLPKKQRALFHRFLALLTFVLGGVAFVLIPLLCHAVLLTQGKEAFDRNVAALNGTIFFALLLIAGLALLYIRRYHLARRRTIGLFAVFLVFFDLASLGAYIDLEPNDPTVGFFHPEAVGFLKSDKTYYRIDTGTGILGVWQPNTSLLYEIFDVTGLWNPLQLADYKRYWDAVGRCGLRSSRLYDFTNAKYVIGLKDVTLDWEKFTPVFDGDPNVNIYLNTKALPRAFLVHRALVVDDHETALERIQEPGFDPSTTVIVEGGKPLDIHQMGESSVEIVSYSPNEINLNVMTSEEAYLVLSEVFYPGWKVYVNGKEEEVLRANYAFRAVYLKPGRKEVCFVFEPLSWKVGLILSSATMIGLLTWGLLSLRRRS